MECNKEEAIRARDIAERKMQSKDFVGARKIARKAQQLFPELENVSQILSVCDVHCAAEVKSGGSEMDWYGILQLEITADEATVRKQFRKLALLLHPDKNKFCGAEAAFKLIGEAQRVLLDKRKRWEHDMKRNKTAKAVARPQPPNAGQQNSHNNSMNRSQNFGAASQQQHSSETFWTLCPFCGIRYQYYKTIMNRALRCQNCMKPFIAYDMNAQGGPGVHSGPQSKPPISQKREAFRENIQNMGQQSAARKPSNGDLRAHVGTTATDFQSTSKKESSAEDASLTQSKFRADGIKDEGGGGTAESAKEASPAANRHMSAGRKRGRKEATKSSESFETSSADNEDENMEFNDPLMRQKYEAGWPHCPRRSARKKQQVVYGEDGNHDDNDVNSPGPKRSKGATQNSEAASYKDGGKEENENEILFKDDMPNGRLDKNTSRIWKGHREAGNPGENLKMDESSDAEPGESAVVYSEPEFYNFDQDRTETCVKVNQIWALYDDREGMPRFYAQIKKILSPSFEVQLTWLEPIARTEEVPVACGRFKLGVAGTSDTISTFSFLVSCEKGRSRNTYDIYPKKGDVWALFKNWDIKWTFDLHKYKNSEFEIVEVLSDYSEGNGVEVGHLVKVKGFISLFQPVESKGTDTFRIASEEMLRFSHKIPIYRMSGKERKDVPERSIELDPAAVPAGLEEFEPLGSFSDVKLENKINDSMERDLNFKTSDEGKDILKSYANGSDILRKENPGIEVRSPKKVNGYSNEKPIILDEDPLRAKEFDDKKNGCYVSDINNSGEGSRLKNNLNEEQVEPSVVLPTSLTRDAYELPGSEFHNFETAKSADDFQKGQFWALYSEEDGMPKYYAQVEKVGAKGFSVKVRWFESCAVSKEESRWFKEGLPIGCGTFKLGSSDTFDAIGTFSHLVYPLPTSRNRFLICPRKNEIWAMYKNWRQGWSISDLVDCEYELVEILDDSGRGFKVMVLGKVEGYRYVFKPVGTKDVPQDEMLRFSHQVPAFHLTEERGGKLRGYFELDPASLPEPFICSHPK